MRAKNMHIRHSTLKQEVRPLVKYQVFSESRKAAHCEGVYSELIGFLLIAASHK